MQLKTTGSVVVLALLAGCGLGGTSSSTSEVTPPAKTLGATAFCGPDDRPETGAYQGQTPLADMESGRSQDPYYCGLRIVGHNDILNRGGNWQLSRIDDCAYMTTLGDGVGPDQTVNPAGTAVIDVRDPTQPKLVQILRTPGAVAGVEAASASQFGERKVFATSPSNGTALDIYDASGDCTQPTLAISMDWPGKVHDITVSPSTRFLYGSNFCPAGCTEPLKLFVLDIAELAKPRLLAALVPQYPDGSPIQCHTVTFNADETRMYCADGYQTEAGGAPSIWDISDFKNGITDPQVRFVGVAEERGQGWHHVVPAMIGGKPHLVAANELGCDGAFPRIFDISDETSPRLVGEFKTEVQKHCAEEEVAAENAMGNYGSHYNNVDDYYGDTRLGLFGMLGAGVRIVDLRDPTNPREVAYFKPGANPDTTLQNQFPGPGYHNNAVTDACGGRNWWNPHTQQIWISCQNNGFYVAELSSEVKKYLETPLPMKE